MQVLNLVLLGYDVSSKTSPLSYIVKFCCCWLVMVFPRNFWNPILRMGCRCQIPKFPTIFDCESPRSKAASDFALEFPKLPNCPSDKQKRPEVQSNYQANSRISKHCSHWKSHCRASGDVSSIPSLTTALNMWRARRKWLRLSKFNSCPRALTP